MGVPRRSAAPPIDAPLCEGRVVAGFGRHCLVEPPEGPRVLCHPRGKKSEAVVGDRVRWQPSGDEGRIEQVLARRNLFFRQDEVRTKSFAANLDQVLVLLAAEPEFSEQQLARALIAARAERIGTVIALNKQDLAAPFARAWERLAPYRAMDGDTGTAVLGLALRTDPAAARAALAPGLAGRTTLVLGPSGAGKSTLVNLLVPDAAAVTGEISHALNSGRHTTTSTTWYWIDRATGSALIDSPGFQEFGLQHIAPTQLAALMPDIVRHAGDCRFYNCTHLHEPGCAVIAHIESAAGAHPISASRYKIYSTLFAELSQSRY